MQRRFRKDPYTAAGKQYVIRMAAVMVAYIFTVLATRYVVRQNQPAGGPLLFLAMMPAIPVVAMLGVIGMYLREEKNGAKREMTVRSLLWAIAGTLGITSCAGFLRSYGVREAMLPPFTEFVVFWAAFGMAQAMQAARLMHRK
jgi:ABC-type proline/glycine betaine transport system permease subunit